MAILPGDIDWPTIIPEMRSGTLSDANRAVLATYYREQLASLATTLDATQRVRLTALLTRWGGDIEVDVAGAVRYPPALSPYLRVAPTGPSRRAGHTRVIVGQRVAIRGTVTRRLRIGVNVRDARNPAIGVRVLVLNGPLVAKTVAARVGVVGRIRFAAEMRTGVRVHDIQVRNNPAVRIGIAGRVVTYTQIRVGVASRVDAGVGLRAYVIAAPESGTQMLTEAGDDRITEAGENRVTE